MVRVFILLGLLLQASLVASSRPLTQSAAERIVETCGQEVAARALVEHLPAEFDAIRWQGYFPPASPQLIGSILEQYEQYGKNPPDFSTRKLRKARAHDITEWACTYEGAKETPRQFRLRSTNAWNATLTPPAASRLSAKIAGLGYDGFSPLHWFTSGAGNWRRGGGLVKANLPLNLQQVVTPELWEEVVALSNFVSSDHAHRRDIYGKAVAKQPSYLQYLHVQDIEPAEKRMREIILEAKSSTVAINPLEAKLAQVAVLSAVTRRYIHFDVWSSRATHSEIQAALIDFKENYQYKLFVEDEALNSVIHDMIERYIAASELLNETHLFGYQVEVWPLSPDALNPQMLFDEAANGEGAGRAYTVMDVTGRRAQLKARGVQHWMFQNIEVLSMDLLAQYGAFLKLDKPVGVVVVPVKDGYTGGFPYVEEIDDGSLVRLYEGIGVPKELSASSPGDYFNTNTIFHSLDLNDVDSLDFEPNKPGRRGGRVTLAKISLALLTHTNRTGLIGDDIGNGYQNFKYLTDYAKDGVATLQLFREALIRELGSRQSPH
jgi:hypothetical protein